MSLIDKSVLVTGADGFIGSHLVETLQGKCRKLRAFCQYNSFDSWGNLEDVLSFPTSAPCGFLSGLTSARTSFGTVDLVMGDVRDPMFCNGVLKDIDIIFNLAALIAIPYSYKAPQSYIDTNVGGALNICNAALENGAKLVIQMSTSEVYGTAEYVPIDEEHPQKPQSPYSASKIGADSIAMSYWHTYDLPVVIARPFNTYGPRQSARAFIPTIISQIAAGKKEILLGDTTPTRDLNYVKDTCDALVALASCEEAIGETVNIGTGYEHSVGDIFFMIRDIMGASDVTVKLDEIRLRPENSEVMRLVADNKKLRRLTGFKPAYTLDSGLRETVDWVMGHMDRYKPDFYTV